MSADSSAPRGAREQAGGGAAPLLLLCAILAGVLLYVFASRASLADGPVTVVWDKTACAHCAMHLGDPRFAAQLTTEGGETCFYDDPGCLFQHRKELLDAGKKIHAMWFRNLNEDSWLSADEAMFIRTEGSPMDFGLGAVRRGAAKAMTLAEAEQEVLSR